jgi:hypothetical protein
MCVPQTFLYKLRHYKSHLFRGNHSYWANLEKPQTFNEKILWLKRYHRFDLGPVIADKVTVQDYVKTKIGEEILIPQVAVYSSADEIDFNSLPEQCVLKPNHGSGWVIIIKGDETKQELEEYRKQLRQWMSWNAYYLFGEWQYKNIERKIICEPFIHDLQNVIDYRFYCFNGQPELIQLDLDRYTKHKRAFKDLYWNDIDIELKFPKASRKIPKPLNLKRMIEISSILCQRFIFARVDLFNVNGKIYFGEITLHPAAGNGTFGTYNQDLQLGRMLDLSPVKK